MAITPNNNEAFFREVDEELRREQLGSWWKRYGIAVIVGVVLLIGAIGGFLWWQNEQQRKAGEAGETFTALLEDAQKGKAEANDPRLEALAKDGTDGYRAAALLTKADLAASKDQDQAAIATFKQVAADESLPEAYRDLALIRHTAMEFDKLQPGQVIDRLTPLAKPGNPWFGSAAEMVAMAHLKAGRPQQAAALFAALAKDETISDSLRSRSVQMAGSLGVDAVKDAPAAGAAKEANQ